MIISFRCLERASAGSRPYNVSLPTTSSACSPALRPWWFALSGLGSTRSRAGCTLLECVVVTPMHSRAMGLLLFDFAGFPNLTCTGLLAGTNTLYRATASRVGVRLSRATGRSLLRLQIEPEVDVT